ncbi:hypothetical protein AWW66_01260 [Micromonospora rosaria]|uniref:Metallo-beta-lactamase domain-containing protein n=1 Tax=Micromonospora rosaria TaxID=47874 RepID=A0A136PZV2_9ACTN|nr:N-acyl homoserine lactonase family protein [Micromonospora rosaria]KXK63834.1 hypothetical protein AWW66_01260 [Micromonospora rosaria]
MRLHLLRLGTIAGLDAPVPGYLVRADDGTNLLVDTGPPVDAPDPAGVLTVAPHERVDRVLDGLGLRPADIHVVVCTHLDPDHAGNHALFPDAEFVVQRRHHEAALAGRIDRIARTRPRWDVPGARYRLVDGDTTLLPGVELVETSGHVPGHQSVLVRLPGDGPVLLAGDAIPMGIAADPQERPILPFDLHEEDTRRSTARLVALAGAEGALLVFGHDPVQWPALRTGTAGYR